MSFVISDLVDIVQEEQKENFPCRGCSKYSQTVCLQSSHTYFTFEFQNISRGFPRVNIKFSLLVIVYNLALTYTTLGKLRHMTQVGAR